MTSIFIKTYYKDFQWLQYLLPSIEKYTDGFQSVVIVSDNDGHKVPDEYINTIKKYRVDLFYVDLPTKVPQDVEHPGVGYIWQQYIKLHWFRYCSSDAVLVLDSDEVIITHTVPDDFKYNGKWIWGYRRWEDAEHAICHKPSTDRFLRMDTAYEAMCEVGFVLSRDSTEQLLKYLADQDLWKFMVDNNIGKLSEYNIYGSFVYHIYNREYFHNINRQIPRKHNIIIRWSWGGITDQIHQENIKYINS
jgi:hypothetical protein